MKPLPCGSVLPHIPGANCPDSSKCRKRPGIPFSLWAGVSILLDFAFRTFTDWIRVAIRAARLVQNGVSFLRLGFKQSSEDCHALPQSIYHRDPMELSAKAATEALETGNARKMKELPMVTRPGRERADQKTVKEAVKTLRWSRVTVAFFSMGLLVSVGSPGYQAHPQKAPLQIREKSL